MSKITLPNITKTFKQRVLEYKDIWNETSLVIENIKEVKECHYELIMKELKLLHEFNSKYPWYRLEDR